VPLLRNVDNRNRTANAVKAGINAMEMTSEPMKLKNSSELIAV